jgi:ATP-binding cassette subfamily F protein uup
MSTLISCHHLAKSHGARTLFSELSLNIAPGERLGIIGANGAGKSSLLRILAGIDAPDAGQRMQRKGLRIALVEQEPAFEAEDTVDSALQRGGAALDEAERRLRAAELASRLGFADAEQPVAALSGGWRKRLAIARALMPEPELLLLDEPTNHLDLEGILWLQDLLARAAFGFALVTHDRALLQAVCGRVAELDPRHPGGLLLVDGDYGDFLERRGQQLAARDQHAQALANKVRREVAWLRRGPKARATKAKDRLDRAAALQAELAALREQRPGQAAAVSLSATGRRSRRLLAARGLSASRGGRLLFSDLDLLLHPGLKLGLVGPNGSGKSTLLELLAGRRAPDAGHIARVDGLRVALFEQGRQALDPAQSLRRSLAPDGDQVIFQGRSQHVVGWARRFGFRAEQLDARVGSLSGGERARIAIARLMLEPADVLLLDEPTNDLDIPTLETLEDSLLAFPGALVLVTHDRALLDRVADLILGLDGRGGSRLVADLEQWIRRPEPTERDAPSQAPAAGGAAGSRPAARRKPTKLGYLEQRELDGMEAAIEAAEAELDAAEATLADPAVASDAEALLERQQQQAAAQARVDALYERWAELEAKRDALADDGP